MAIQVVLVEEDQKVIEDMLVALRKSPEFEIAAIYKTAESALGQSKMFQPELFLIDVDNEKSVSLISAFIETYPDAKVLGMMTYWKSATAYECLKGGAVGCILKSFTIEEIKKALKLYELRGKNAPSRVIAFFSPKGRAGRTTVASILALELEKKSGERVALIDADLQFGDMPIFFDVEPEHTIVEATQDIKLLNPLTFEPYFHKIKDSVYLLSSPDKPEYAELVDVESFIEVVRMTCCLFRYVLIDLPAGFNPISISTCDLSGTDIVMAMLNNVFDIHHMRRTLEVFQTFKHGHKKVYTCFTRVNPCTEDERLKIQRELGYPVTDILPNEYQMISLANSGRLLKGLPKDSLLIQKIGEIADDVINERR